jgi:ribosomal protein S18 acetylase RimI-like enzyme
MIEKLKISHIDQIVAIHTICFPENQSTEFGANFLKAHYLGHINAPNAVCFVYEDKGKIVGFIVGGVNLRNLLRQVFLNSKIRFLISLFINIAKNPKITISKYYGYAKSYLLPKSNEKTFYSDNTAGLESVAVLPKYRGRGIAEQLTEVFLRELNKRKIGACRLGVKADNIPARKFYEKMGFKQNNKKGTSYIYIYDNTYRKIIGKNSW